MFAIEKQNDPWSSLHQRVKWKVPFFWVKVTMCRVCPKPHIAGVENCSFFVCFFLLLIFVLYFLCSAKGERKNELADARLVTGRSAQTTPSTVRLLTLGTDELTVRRPKQVLYSECNSCLAGTSFRSLCVDNVSNVFTCSLHLGTFTITIWTHLLS